jgi:Bacterial protein of unknown function (DUF885)
VPDDPVKIILMPEFKRGVAIAYCDSPGPLDRGQATYYSISPIPDEWTKAQVDFFLRQYNTRMLHLLSIHEAVPGHHLEAVHSIQNPSILRAVLRSGVFAEGWAVYTEDMLADAGYLDGDPLFRLRQLKVLPADLLRTDVAVISHRSGDGEDQASLTGPSSVARRRRAVLPLDGKEFVLTGSAIFRGEFRDFGDDGFCIAPRGDGCDDP